MLSLENELVILPAQDLLWLGSEARMNRPGTTDGHNWKWKLELPLTTAQAEWLAELTIAAGRGIPPPPESRSEKQLYRVPPLG